MEQDQTSLQDVPHAIPAAETDVGDDPRRPEASEAACERCGDPPIGALLFRTGDGLPQAPAVSSQPHCLWTLRAAVRLVHDHVCGAVRQCCVLKVLSPVLHPLQGFVQGGLRRQPVEAEAEDAHGPRDVRGAV